jgi:hypothetical protein
MLFGVLKGKSMKMSRTSWIGFCAFVLVCQVSGAQNSVGNALSGDAKVEVLHSYSGPDALLKPERVVIQNFTTVGDVVMDESMATRLHQHSLLHRGSGEDATPEALIRKVQDSFAKTLVAQFKKVNIASDRVTDASSVVGPALIVEGEFIAVNQGDATQRIMLGFGRGASDIKTHVIISLAVNGSKTVLLDCNINSQSGKKPGAIVSMGGGSLAVGAATGDLGDNKATVQGDASRMAKLVAKQTEAVMVAQKWIPAPQK